MSRSTPSMRALAGRLIAVDAGGAKSSRNQRATAFPVAEKLRPHLATLMGNDGYRALLMRARALASEEVAWLRSMRVAADGSLERLDTAAAPLMGATEMLEGRVVLVAQLLGLLVDFIGESLTLRLVREVWPKLAPENLNASKDHENEK